MNRGTCHSATSGGAEPAGELAGRPSDPQDLADAMLSVWGTLNFGPLEEIVDR